MPKSPVEQRIREVLVNSLSLNIAPDDIPVDRPFGDVIGFDSMSMLEYVVALEKEFGISIDQDALSLDLLTDITLLARYIRSRPDYKGAGI